MGSLHYSKAVLSSRTDRPTDKFKEMIDKSGGVSVQGPQKTEKRRMANGETL